MLINENKYSAIRKQLDEKNVLLVAVSKTKPVEAIRELYALGHQDFGENYVQELLDKQQQLPSDIHWHFIGHLQTNKVKYLAPFVHLIHGVDSLKLLREINKQALKVGRIINVLLQVYIAQEETKFGFDSSELEALFAAQGAELAGLTNIRVVGFMGMASYTENLEQVRQEFRNLKVMFDRFKEVQAPNISLSVLSMGMSGDYAMAVEEGSTMVRIGSLIFGERSYPA